MQLFVYLVFTLFCYLSRNRLCPDLRTFVWRKIEPKIAWRKNDKYQVWKDGIQDCLNWLADVWPGFTICTKVSTLQQKFHEDIILKIG